MSKILVVGDLMLDEYVDGDVDRISPEAPVPILNCKTVSRSLGGAGNLVANLVGLGHIPYVLGAVGSDYAGGLISEILSELGVPFDFIKVQVGRTTTRKTRFCSSGQHILRADKEIVGCVDLFNEVESLGEFDYVIVSDYAKGVVTIDLLSELKNRFLYKSTLILDPNINNLDIYNDLDEVMFDYITPNIHEAKAFNNRKDSSIKSIARNLTRLSNNIIITLGKDGVFALERSFPKGLKAEYIHKQIKHKPIDIVDVSGAGDTVVATFVDGLIKGMSFFDAVEYSQKMASIVVSKRGTYAIRKEDI